MSKWNYICKPYSKVHSLWAKKIPFPLNLEKIKMNSCKLEKKNPSTTKRFKIKSYSHHLQDYSFPHY